MKWVQASELTPPLWPNKAIAVYDNGEMHLLGRVYLVSENRFRHSHIRFEYDLTEMNFKLEQADLVFLKWLDEKEEDSWITLKAMFVRELKDKSLITAAQLTAILNFMQNK